MKPTTSYRWFDYRARRGNGILIKIPSANFDDPNEFEPIAADIYAALPTAEVWIVGPSVNPHRLGVLMPEMAKLENIDKILQILNKFYGHADLTIQMKFGPEQVAEERRAIEYLTSRINAFSCNLTE